jgi:phosphoribosylformimino-5-aminoimidazole carboxamide ribotide isomerase
MNIYPALDIMNHKVVRLTQGDFSSAKIYANDPVAVAREFAAAGASFLHLIDLEGAKIGAPTITDIISQITRATDLRVQVGGGLRTLKVVKSLFDIGVDRIIIGSLAIRYPDGAVEYMKAFGPERITIALDCVQCDSDDPVVAINGWQTQSPVSLWDLLDYYVKFGVGRVLCTDIQRDGMNQGCNYNLYKRILARFPDLNIQASGGIASIAEIRNLTQLGLESCILGKSLYEGKVALRDALNFAGVTC